MLEEFSRILCFVRTIWAIFPLCLMGFYVCVQIGLVCKRFPTALAGKWFFSFVYCPSVLLEIRLYNCFIRAVFAAKEPLPLFLVQGGGGGDGGGGGGDGGCGGGGGGGGDGDLHKSTRYVGDAGEAEDAGDGSGWF